MIGFAVAPSAAAPPRASSTITVYRCTNASGHLALRDSPCRAGERQEVRTMARPTDPPPGRTVTTARAPSAPPAVNVAPTTVVYRTAPRPLFECTTPDGDVYTSENGEGNPRWVPLWTLGYPIVVGVPPRPMPHRGPMPVRGGSGVAIGTGMTYATVPGGSWIRDVCHSLPPAEVCARMQDRREALDRRWFSALQGDRDAIEHEQRSLDARLGEECG
ncbi:DUF4124 domain-containing protein [Lysobacter sp. TY2-98]|nr:DUF4124 domain-containing protein [Lysobacter sp. TY2-98]